MMQKVAIVTSHLEQSGITPDLVAKVVLNAVTSENPNLRYLVGRDVEEYAKSKDSMTDAEFHMMMVG